MGEEQDILTMIILANHDCIIDHNADMPQNRITVNKFLVTRNFETVISSEIFVSMV